MKKETFNSILATGICALLMTPQIGFAASLKPLTIINTDVFTVGDVFDGIDSAKASKVLGPTPQPGKDLVLNSVTLNSLSRALNLGWKPSGPADQAVLRRAATIVDTETIRTALTEALRKEGVTGRFELTFNGGNPQMILPQDKPATAEIKSIRFDAQHDFVEASVAAPSAANPIAQTIISGKVQRFTSVPVLKESLTNGDIIGKNDLMTIDVPTQSLQGDIVLSEEKLVGMTPRRLAEAGKPVRDADLQRPQIVSRGDSITIVYEKGPITLTTKGKAMQGGAKGDMVQVVNVSSNRSLDATISGDRQVTIIE